MSIEVIKPGLATTVQDDGRSGYYHVGIPPSGALDQFAFRAANLLVGNPETAAVLELCMLGPELHFRQPAVIAVTGAAMAPRIDGLSFPCNQSLQIRAGQIVSFDLLRAGARAYLAVAGGIDVPLVLGSRSSYGLGGFGGFQGRQLKAGDVLATGPAAEAAFIERSLPAQLCPILERSVELRLLPGLYDHRVTAASLEAFFSDSWKVGAEADRIAYRLKGGSPLEFVERAAPFGAGSDPSNVVDGAYPVGSVQVPAGREPIILHRDAVSGGGYMMIGCVISADLDLIAQLQPNFSVRFVKVDMAEALAARKQYQQKILALRKAFDPV